MNGRRTATRQGRIARLTAGILGTAVLAAGAHAAAQPVTFADVAPIVYTRCAPCHHDGGDGPFSLVTYDEVKRHGTAIAAAIKSGYMPPWKPSSDSGPFLGERRLSDAERSRLEQWIAGGAPAGGTAPPPPAFSAGWLSGPPDLVVSLPAFMLNADGPDVFRNFVVAVPGAGTKYVRTFQFRPLSRAVHHANIRIDRTPASRRLDDADPDPGYSGVILNSAEYPDGHFLGWTPGQAPAPGPPDLGWRLDGGSDLVVQLHMQPTGRSELVQPAIGFYFSDQPPSSTPVILRLGRQNIDIPAGDAHYRSTDSFTLPVDVNILAVQPHAHRRARQVSVVARLPDGTRRMLIRIPDWDFRWQDQYRFVQPLRLPAGSVLELEYLFDNSGANIRNPDHPPQRVEWGWRTSDEMGDAWIQMQTASSDARDVLAARTRRKMDEEQAIGSEVLVSRDPDYPSLRNDAAMTYMALGRPLDALRHFEAVTRLTPGSAIAWYNEGVALAAAGRRDDAMGRYRRAIQLDPSYSQAHNNLGNLLAAGNQIDAAMASYQAAIQADGANAEAHCSLAQAMLLRRQPRAASIEFSRALDLAPDWTACAISYVWLLSAHSDPLIRDPAKAMALASRAVSATRAQDIAALDAFAAANASAGRFDEAATAASQAIALARKNRNDAAAAAIQERLDGYRRRQPFIVPD